MKVDSYKVVRDSVTRLSFFEEEVNKLISEGWQPYGTPTIAKLDKQDILIQPMIKHSQQ
jgi:hypothetical protein